MWTKVARVSDVKEGEGVAVEVSGRRLAVFKHKGKFCAIEGTCPHRGGPLAEGRIEDGEVICPWHAWGFEIETGACGVLPGEGNVATFPCKVEGEDVWVDA